MRVEVKLKVLKQLYARLLRRCEVPFTNKHAEVMGNLLTLGTSHYRNVILVLISFNFAIRQGWLNESITNIYV